MPTGLGLGLKLKFGGQLWSPSDLGASLLGWWDAEDAATITQAATLVSSWKDKVGAYDAVQVTGASKPVYSATSFNSRPGVSFDGTDDSLTYSGVGAFPTGATAGEMWALVDQTAAAADVSERQVICYGGTASANIRRLGRTVIVGQNRARSTIGDGASNFMATDATVALDGRHVLRASITPTAVAIAVDGGALSAGTAVVPATGTTATTIGATTFSTAFWGGVVSAVLITSSLSADQASRLASYLKTRGGIA